MKFYIETYGCQMNVSDSELVTKILVDHGYKAAVTIDEAQIIIFNTCSIRQHAENRVIGRITNEMQRKKSNPAVKIGVIGCMAQRLGQELLDMKMGIDFIVGVDNYDKLPDLITSTSSDHKTDINANQMYDDIQPIHENGVCGYVTIMRGCDNYCSYCIVPYVRGRERSRSAKSIIHDTENAVKQGIRDITLLGQNVNSYQWNGHKLSDLLRLLNNIEGLYRLRFITSHPKDLSDDLIEAMTTIPKVCEHIHLPLQSGDNKILARMNRKYSIEQYKTLVQKLRTAIPHIAITTDLIAGFPGESEDQFNNTLNAMQDIKFDYAFCFKYSERTGTQASKMKNQIDEKTRLHRLQKMIDVQRIVTRYKFQSQIGKMVEVLVEGKSRQGTNQYSGKTRDNKICVFDGTDDYTGKLVKVKVINATSGTLIAKQV
jgi:tRNA-2-methylthio-N6-dimethylallyladenosine synthase